MKQGNAIDLLGQDDPRATSIGIIYVSPTDDRRSVLTAIFTQEKLERKQIAIVLPTQNKAFHRPADFDDLKNVRRKLQAELVFIAPGGLGSPAEFARQRRFKVYSSLEIYARALRDEAPAAATEAAGPADGGRKRGFLGGRSADKAAGGRDKSGPYDAPAPLVVPIPVSDPGVQPATSAMSPVPPRHTPPGVTPAGDIQDMPTAPVNAGGHATSVPTGHPEPAPAPAAAKPLDEEDEWALSPPDQSPAPVPGPVVSSGTTGTAAPPPARPPATPNSEPAPLVLGGGTKSRRKTVELDKKNPPASPAVEDIPTQVIPPTPRRSQSGKIAAAGVVGAAALGAGLAAEELASHSTPAGAASTPAAAGTPTATGTAAAPASTTGSAAAASAASPLPAPAAPVPLVRPSGPSNPPPPARGRGGRGGGGGRRGPGRLLIAGILVLAALLLFGAIALAAPGLVKSMLNAAPSYAYSVSITPATQKGNDTYVVTAVTGTPDPTALQVQAQVLTGQAQSQSKTVNATGKKQTDPIRATGQVTFYNGTTSSYVFGASTPLYGTDGVAVYLDKTTTIPAGNPPNSFGSITVNAHAGNAGANGNIAARDIDRTCCTGGITVRNLQAFTGGQDAQNYTVVAQSDIDNVSNPAIPGLTTQAQQALNAKLTKNLRYAEQGTCTPTVDSDHQAGDKATTVTVTVTVNCQREAYDVSQIPAVVTTHLQENMQKALGADFSSYKMVDAQGNPTSLATVNSITSKGTDPQTHVVTLDVAFSSLWVYQISAQQLQAMKAHIAGKSVAQALTYLKSQRGVADASISPNSGTLPTDTGQIGLSLVKQSGPAGSGTPGTGGGGGNSGGTPIITSPTAGSGTGVGRGDVSLGWRWKG